MPVPKNWVNRAHALLDSTLRPPKHELNEIDWKINLSTNKSRLVEHLCAFGNYPGGGYLAYGISDEGQVRGTPCECPAVRGKKRCRMHSGLSTGPRTATGLVHSKPARWKHGRFSVQARQEMARYRELLRECKEMA